MKKLLAGILSVIGVAAAGAASTACVMLVLDEPTMPKSMIER